MSTWDIDVNGVSAVLGVYNDQLGTEGGGLSEEIDSTGVELGTALESVKSPPVEIVLAEFLEYYSEKSETMFLKGLSCLKGVSEAVIAYQAGDYEMASTAQEDAGSIDALDLDACGEGS
ncbi:hypothetical protein GTW20_03990 [Nocardiopsis alba]|uniref:Uncharacterized protein n=1 Tax=Nocardiopsis alba TaxID=53437 RepID=A0A7K2INK9_9ACTN|nr:hypothetical protein [Nocardiopsis alba]